MVKIRFLAKLLTCVLMLILVYSEFLVYTILPLRWRGPPLCVAPKCYKLLLVADPQILGTQNTAFGLGWIANYIARLDSDRYLLKTFAKALDHIGPDLVVFLGDIMDEGHITTDVEFLGDLRRFENIFRLPEHHRDARIIILPGDNDIGGEDDIMLPHAVHRFERVFDQSDGPVILDSLELYKVNFLSYTLQEPYSTDSGDDIIRVVVSHLPILSRAGPFVQVMVKKVRPHIVFTGHRHNSIHVVSSLSDIWKRAMSVIGPNETEAKAYDLGRGLVHEFAVPTCSYRMGVTDMGYGTAFIDTEKKVLVYDVLWLPARFKHLLVYVVALLALALAFSFVSVVWVSLRVRRLLRCFHSKVIASTYQPFIP